MNSVVFDYKTLRYVCPPQTETNFVEAGSSKTNVLLEYNQSKSDLAGSKGTTLPNGGQ